MSGIKTGNPGFVNPVDGKVYTINPSSSEDPEVNPVSENPDPGDMNVDNSVKDISKKTRVTLGKYLSELTKGKVGSAGISNEYSVDPPTEGAFGDLLSPLTNPSTNRPMPLAGFANSDSFADRDQIKPLSNDPSLVGSGFSKGKSEEAKYDGHNLLQTVNGNVNVVDSNVVKHGSGANYESGGAIGNESNDEFGTKVNNGVIVPLDHPIANYKTNNVSSVLAIGNNRWAVRSNPSNSFNAELTLSDEQKASQLKMAQIAIALMQRAAGETPGRSADKSNPYNPSSNEAEVKALIPSLTQLGGRVNNEILTAQSAYDALTDDEVGSTSLMSISAGGESWGSVNSPSEPFSDTATIGLGITVSLLIIAINVLINTFTPPNNFSTRKARTGREKLVKGKYKFANIRNSNPINDFTIDFTNIYEVLGLVDTNNDFTTALNFGARAFFFGTGKTNITQEQVALGALGVGLDSLFDNVSTIGANLAVARSIIRSGIVLADNSALIYRRIQDGSYINAAASTISLFRQLRSSKLFAAINVFASLGDNLLDLKRGFVLTGPDGNPYQISTNGFEAITPDLFTDINGEIPTKQINGYRQTVTKSRLSYLDYYDPALAWGAARSPSMYLTSPEAEDLAIRYNPRNNLGAFYGRAALSDSTNAGNKHPIFHLSSPRGSTSARISNEDRDAFEKILDAEYVPFSFQDIRTNEIISFHAFLASLSDDYTSNYDSVEGFGRVEPVKIYKGTTRKISLSFYVAATSEDDFDHMWFKINKLTTMIYPQYTSGRSITNVNRSFNYKAPFSEQPGSTPVIRIRLGDLIRSNYSRFALARLFGAADQGTVLFNNKGQISPVFTPTDKEDYLQQRKNAVIEKWNSIWKSTPDGGTPPETWFIGKQLDDLTDQYYNVAEWLNRYYLNLGEKNITEDDLMNLKITGILDAVNPASIPATAQPDDFRNGAFVIEGEAVRPPGSPVEAITNIVNEARNTFNENTGFIYANTRKFDIIIPAFYLGQFGTDVLQEYIQYYLQELETVDKEAPGILEDFMKPGNNAIVKSFESAGGKGLAGVIESMNFDWYERATWETSLGSTAPKFCKVTISFSPIHDITPGLDYHGYNRAPIYPVGKAMSALRRK